METSLTRNEKIIAIIAFTVVAAFFALFMQVNRSSKGSPQFDSSQAIDYRMARPDQTYSEYTLDGRELDETYEGLTKIEDKLAKKKEEMVAKQKAEEKKKKEEAKKKQSLVSRIQQQLENAKNKFEQMLQAKEEAKAQDKVKKDAVAQNTYSARGVDAAQAAQDAADTTKDTTKDKSKKSYSEWRALLLASPTSENLALFLAAYRKNEVTATEYQAMAQDLLEQTDSKYKALGLMALRAVPSLASLSQLVHLEGLSAEYQAYVEQAISLYILPQNLQYLNQALLTSDKTLVSKSLNLLNINLPKLIQGDTASFVDPRNSRNSDVGTLSINDYATLVPALTQLAQSGDSDLSGLAQQVAALIQSTNNVAQN